MEKDQYEIMRNLEETHWWYRGIHNLIVRLINKSFENGKIKLLDAGCGTGGLLERLRTMADVEGLDCHEDAVFLSQKRGLPVRQADLNHLELPPDHYDVVTCIDVLYHEWIEDELGVLQCFHKALKPGGLLIVQLPAFELLRRTHDLKVKGVRRYMKRQMVQALSELGFSVELASYRMPLLFLYILFKKNFERTDLGDLRKNPRIINNFLLKMSSLENSFIMNGFPLPFGSSLFLMGKKKRMK